MTVVIIFKYIQHTHADIENCLALTKGNEAEIVTQITYNSDHGGKQTRRVARESFRRLQVNFIHNDQQLWLNDEVSIILLYICLYVFILTCGL